MATSGHPPPAEIPAESQQDWSPHSGSRVRMMAPMTRPARISSIIPECAPDRPRARQHQVQRAPIVINRVRPPPEKAFEVLATDDPRVLSRPDLLMTQDNPIPFWFTAPRLDSEERRKAADHAHLSPATPPPRLRESPYPNSRAAETLANSPNLQLFRTRMLGLAQSSHAQPRPIRLEDAPPALVEDAALLDRLDPEAAIGAETKDDSNYPSDPDQAQAAEMLGNAFASFGSATSTMANWHPAQASDYEVTDLVETIIAQARAGQRKALSRTHQLLRNTLAERRSIEARLRRIPEEAVPLRDLGIPFRPELFKSMLVVLAFDGTSEEARAVHKDMLELGFEPDLFDLNALLRAAARDGNEVMTCQLLDQIAKMPRASGDLPLLSPREMWGLFHGQFVANWTPDTFNSLFIFAAKQDNTEYALALVGLATQFAQAEGGFPESIGKWIPGPVRMTLMSCLFRGAQPGLAYDVLQILLKAEGDSAFEREMWVELLNLFSDQQYVRLPLH